MLLCGWDLCTHHHDHNRPAPHPVDPRPERRPVQQPDAIREAAYAAAQRCVSAPADEPHWRPHMVDEVVRAVIPLIQAQTLDRVAERVEISVSLQGDRTKMWGEQLARSLRFEAAYLRAGGRLNVLLARSRRDRIRSWLRLNRKPKGTR